MSDVSPQVIVIAGPNGAGKTTLAPFLLRDTFGLLEYVNADSLAAGLSAFSPESTAVEAGRIMLRRLHELADHRSNFAFETTLSTRSYALGSTGLGGEATTSIYCFCGCVAPTLQRGACGSGSWPAVTTCRNTLFADVTQKA